jgi:hypothetical protein
MPCGAMVHDKATAFMAGPAAAKKVAAAIPLSNQ